jgi:ribosome-binding factor A
MPKKHHRHDSPKGPSQRQLRVGEELRHALSEIFMRGGFRDPALQNLNVTVSEVRASPDLHNATAFVMPLGGGAVDDVVAALNRASAFIRGEVARSVELRHMPRIDFKADESFAQADAINRLLRRPDVAADLDDEEAHGNGS